MVLSAEPEPVAVRLVIFRIILLATSLMVLAVPPLSAVLVSVSFTSLASVKKKCSTIPDGF